MTPTIQVIIAIAAALSAAGTIVRAVIAWLDRRDRQRWEVGK